MICYEMYVHVTYWEILVQSCLCSSRSALLLLHDPRSISADEKQTISGENRFPRIDVSRSPRFIFSSLWTSDRDKPRHTPKAPPPFGDWTWSNGCWNSTSKWFLHSNVQEKCLSGTCAVLEAGGGVRPDEGGGVQNRLGAKTWMYQQSFLSGPGFLLKSVRNSVFSETKSE